LYASAGCRPVFVPGNANANAWSGILSNGYPVGGREASASLDQDVVTRGEELQVGCPIDGGATRSRVRVHHRVGGRLACRGQRISHL
jgi:hypothetical protein